MTTTAPYPTRADGAAPWELLPGEARNAADLVDAIQTVEKMKAAMDAFLAFAHAELRGIAEAQAERARADTSDGDFAHRSMAAEVAVATRVSQDQAARVLERSGDLTERYPATLQALRDGAISREHAMAITSAGRRLSTQEARGEFERVVLERAPGETAFHTRRIANIIAERIEPDDAEQRCERARARRTVWLTDLDDGLAELGAILPAELAHGAFDRVRRMAAAVRHAERDAPSGAAEAESQAHDERTPGQVRADVLTDLLLTGEPAGHAAHALGGDLLGEIRASVQVTIPVETVMGDAPAAAGRVPMLTSGGLVDPDIARRLAKRQTMWQRVFVRPATGEVVATDTYRPTAEQRRMIEVRDETCRFPGCRVPAGRCDVDHTIDHAFGGTTSTDNLGALCRSHHTLKHQTPWKVKQAAPGVFEWTSPAGQRTRTEPRSRVRFEAFDPPPDPPRERRSAPWAAPAATLSETGF